MNWTRSLAAAALLALASGSVFAALSPSMADWAKGPEQFLMTKDDVSAWKSVQTDDQAKAFVDLFWARRDPTPATPRNEFRDEFNLRVEYADKNFGEGKLRGALTDRGRILILFGAPSRVQASKIGPTSTTEVGTTTGATTSNLEHLQASSPKQVWIYESNRIPKFINAPSGMEIAFVDQYGAGTWKLDRAPKTNVTEAMATAVTAVIVSPNLKEVPKYASAAPPRAAAQALAAPAAAFKNAAFQAEIDAFKAAKESPYKNAFVDWTESVTATGEYFVPVMIYFPKASAPATETALTFFAMIEDDGGKPVGFYDEPAKLAKSGGDFYYDKSLTLAHGKYVGYFGLAGADAKPITIVKTGMVLSGLDKDATGISRLFLAADIHPLEAAQKPTDPFAFGGIKVVPKVDQNFTKADELWYFFELRNPGLVAAPEPAAASAAPAATSTAPAPSAAALGVGLPKIQVKLEVDGKRKFAAQPMMVDAQELKGVPGHYAIGSSIPLGGFPAGDYTLKVKVMDTIKKQTYDLSGNFKVIGDDKK